MTVTLTKRMSPPLSSALRLTAVSGRSTAPRETLAVVDTYMPSRHFAEACAGLDRANEVA